MSRNSVLSVTKKEFKSYFVSPVGYIVIGLYLVVSGWFFFSTLFLSKEVSLREFFTLMPMIFSFIIPSLTMKSFSEEYKTGSYEILGTLPIRKVDITLGKILATWGFAIVMLLPTLSYPLFLSTIGDLDNGVVLCGYLGAVLLSGAFSSIGTLASTFTQNQIIAFLIGAVICFILSIIDGMVILLPNLIAGVIEYISVGYHFNNMARGILDTRDILYFASIIFVSVLATGRRAQQWKI